LKLLPFLLEQTETDYGVVALAIEMLVAKEPLLLESQAAMEAY
jgi:hypothetical protein